MTKKRTHQKRIIKERAVPNGVGPKARKRRFALEYVKDYNGRQAALRAGYAESSATQYAWNLLNNDQEVIDWVLELQRLQMGPDEVEKNRIKISLANMGFANIGDYMDTNNERIDLSKLEKGDPKLDGIVGIKTTVRTAKDGSESVTTELKLDKRGSLEALAKIRGDIVDRIGDPNGNPLAIPPSLNIQVFQGGRK